MPRPIDPDAPDPRSRRHRDAVVAEIVRLNGSEFLDRSTFEAVKRTSRYEWATFADAVDDLVAAAGEAARSESARIARALRSLVERVHR